MTLQRLGEMKMEKKRVSAEGRKMHAVLDSSFPKNKASFANSLYSIELTNFMRLSWTYSSFY
jgi:hypothetical protein